VKTVTSSPLAVNSFTRFCPIEPVAPVISIFFIVAYKVKIGFFRLISYNNVNNIYKILVLLQRMGRIAVSLLINNNFINN
jgi:hypothetical protein